MTDAPEPANLPALPAESPGRALSTWLTPSSFERAMQIAELMAKCGTLPQHLQGKPGDCFRIVVQSAKWGMDPFSVGECTALVHGRMCYEGKLVAAVLTSMGAIVGRLSYAFSGVGIGRTVTITGTPRGGELCTITGTVQDWRTTNKMWDSQPDDMLTYRGTRQWARRYAPEAVLGVYTPDEVETRDVEGVVIDSAPPEVKPARTRGARAEKVLGIKIETAVATTIPSADTVAKRNALIALANTVYSNGSVGAAEIRAIANQLKVTKLGDIPADQLDDAMERVRKAAVLVGAEAKQQTLGGAQ